jgi:hypothetical protein
MYHSLKSGVLLQHYPFLQVPYLILVSCLSWFAVNTYVAGIGANVDFFLTILGKIAPWVAIYIPNYKVVNNFIYKWYKKIKLK